jgi:hypothetical protein
MPDDAREFLAQDGLFGELKVWLDPAKGEVAVEGQAVPEVVLRRVARTKADDYIPIGTRKRGRLTLDVDGQEAVVRPGKGRLTRRSYRVDVRHAGHAYRLVPDSFGGSRLLKDRKHIGDFTSEGDGHVLAEWKEGARVEAADAALGYALAAAFGTGAAPLWTAALEALSDLIPW